MNVFDPANADEVVTPDSNNETSRDEDSVSGHEHCNHQINAATAERTEAPDLNQETTVSAAAAAAAETVPPHQDETNVESLTGNPVQVEAEETVDEVATDNETAQQPTPSTNSNDHRLGKQVVKFD